MKLSIVIADTSAAPEAFVVWRGFEDSIRKAAEMGFQGVELALKKADEVDAGRLDQLLASNSLTVSCISTGQIFSALGLWLTNPDPEIRKAAVQRFKEIIDLAADYGQLVNIGRARGMVVKGQTEQAARDFFLQCARELAQYAQTKNVDIILEPVNRYEINFINNLDEGSALLDALAMPNFGLMPDVFHMNIEDDRIGDSFRRNRRYVKYVHLADSNRRAPGWGHLDFGEVFAALLDINYNGWVSAEILPLPSADEAAAQTAKYLVPLVAGYNQKIKSEGKGA